MFYSSQFSHFNKFAFNQLTNQFVTGEIGPGAFLYVMMYTYTKEQGFTKITETKISHRCNIYGNIKRWFKNCYFTP